MRGENQTALRIAQAAPLWASVPPADYGGTELRVSWLTEELIRRGHQVTLFASGDSKTRARLSSVYPRNLLEAMQGGSTLNYTHYASASLAEALRGGENFDLLHCHTDLEHIAFAILASIPVIYSLRTALSIDDQWLIERYPEIEFVAMSRSQISQVPPRRRPSIPVIHNGCDFDHYDLSTEPGRYLAFLGRMGPHKNPLGAIQIARSVDMPIVLAGQPQDRSERAYFDAEIRPLIDGERVRYIGPVDQARKRTFLREAAALLFPIEWEEPFGIVMIEAMASGTPVIAYRRGSVPEVVDPGITGFYGESVEELAGMVPAALELDRRRVREHARRRFSHGRMVDEYVELYRKTIQGARGGLDVAAVE
ncbi:MAG: glycosyltransferase family 4 protein [Acidobacteria bacterium]|nr:MAG: glycosyltransferase family 4 protein [Acidobacteriota bacterium]